MTVKELITKLLDYELDKDILVEVNGDQEYEIGDITVIGYSARRILLQIEIPQEE